MVVLELCALHKHCVYRTHCSHASVLSENDSVLNKNFSENDCVLNKNSGWNKTMMQTIAKYITDRYLPKSTATVDKNKIESVRLEHDRVGNVFIDKVMNDTPGDISETLNAKMDRLCHKFDVVTQQLAKMDEIAMKPLEHHKK